MIIKSIICFSNELLLINYDIKNSVFKCNVDTYTTDTLEFFFKIVYFDHV